MFLPILLRKSRDWLRFRCERWPRYTRTTPQSLSCTFRSQAYKVKVAYSTCLSFFLSRLHPIPNVRVHRVCLFVGIKPEKLYSASCVGREVNPLGVVTHGQRHKPRAYQRQRHKSRTCKSMVNTLQVDRLARIPGLTPAPYKMHPQPPNSVPSWIWKFHEKTVFKLIADALKLWIFRLY